MTTDDSITTDRIRRRRPHGYWDRFEQIEHELLVFLRELGAEGYMPTTAVFVQAKRSDLLGAIQRHGGLISVAARLELKPWRLRAPAANLPEREAPPASTEGEATVEMASDAAAAMAAERAVAVDVAAESPERRPLAQRPASRTLRCSECGKQFQYPAGQPGRNFERGRKGFPQRCPACYRLNRSKGRATPDERRKRQNGPPAGRARMFKTRCRFCGREIISEQRSVSACKDCSARGGYRR